MYRIIDLTKRLPMSIKMAENLERDQDGRCSGTEPNQNRQV